MREVRGTERADHRRTAPPATNMLCLLLFRCLLFACPTRLRTRVIIIEYAGYTDVVYHDTLPNVSMDDTVVRHVITERYLEVVIMSTLLVKV